MKTIKNITLYGLSWNEHKIRGNNNTTLYIRSDVSLYDKCNKWYIIAQDKENKTFQYLAFHTTKKKKKDIINHVKTTEYPKKEEHILYKSNEIKFNTNAQRDDYSCIFNGVNLYAVPEQDLNTIIQTDPNLNKYINKEKQPQQHWIYQPGEQARLWDDVYNNNVIAIGWEELGDLTQYQTKDDLADKITEIYDRKNYPMNDSLANWEFANVMNVGDIVYVKKGLEEYLIGRGIIESNYYYDDSRKEYKSVRKIKWTHNGKFYIDFDDLEISQFNQKTLTNISENKYGDFCLKLENAFNNPPKTDKNQPKNQILYGPPGTGKTYNTIVKAIEIIEPKLIERDEKGNVSNYSTLQTKFNDYKEKGQIEFVTFHQSYSYEEFVEGIKPQIKNWNCDTEENLKYVGKDGIFKRICKHAEQNLYVYKNNAPIKYASFEETFEEFKNIYPEGSTYDKLHDITYTDENYVGYKFGNQTQIRKIDLTKIKQIFDNNIDYATAIEFNKDYDGNHSLACYHYSFYRELINIKNDINNSIQTKISRDDKKEYTVNKDAKKYVLIIDEINRGNISKIFGELITLIEPDKRIGENHELKITLPYSQNKLFGVPNNLYIIGTMNTSDRSIASVDIALRRRFRFVEMMPKTELVADFKLKEFKSKETKDVADFDIDFKDVFEKLNKRISVLLDRDHQIGHSYFIKDKYEDAGISTLREIWFNEIMPLLNEYFYGDWEKLQALLGEAKNDNTSFITKIDDVDFNNNYTCDEDEKFDFAKIDDNSDFYEALEYAFGEKTNKST